MKTPHIRRLSVLLALALALAAPLRRAAAAEDLTQQQRDLLQVANELSRRCSETIEKWLAAGEVSEDKLWSALYYPIENTDPPKFHTDWDRLSDRDLQALEDGAMAKSSAIVYLVLVDRNGYVPTHNARYTQALTGNMSVDWTGNRTKRIFNNHVEIAAARSTAPYIFQKYFRDNGDVMVDLGVPVMVRGKQFGAIRLGYRPAGQ